jgi:hypothetical protein
MNVTTTLLFCEDNCHRDVMLMMVKEARKYFEIVVENSLGFSSFRVARSFDTKNELYP